MAKISSDEFISVVMVNGIAIAALLHVNGVSEWVPWVMGLVLVVGPVSAAMAVEIGERQGDSNDA